MEAAIEILDAEGADGLTFRALAARLTTGSGAIYWHVADKDALLAAATDQSPGRSRRPDRTASSPRNGRSSIPRNTRSCAK